MARGARAQYVRAASPALCRPCAGRTGSGAERPFRGENMTYDEIAKLPTVIDKIPDGSRGVHESCTRAYQILTKVKWLLEKRTHPDVITELISLMETPPE